MADINCEVFFHGALDQGQEVWPQQSPIPESYIKKLYTQYYKYDVFICETPTTDNPKSSCFYTYLVGNAKDYVVANSDREGSYFAITVQIDNFRIKNVKLLYSLFKEIFDALIIEKILIKTGSGFKFIVKNLSEAEKTLTAAYNQILKALPLMSFEPNSKSSNNTIKEISSKDLHLYTSDQLFSSGIVLKISSTFPSENEKNAEARINQIIRESAQRLQRQIDDDNHQLNKTVNEKDQTINSLKEKNSTLEDAKRSLEREKGDLENEIKDIKNRAQDSLDNFRKWLERGGLKDLQQFCGQGKKGTKGSKPYVTNSGFSNHRVQKPKPSKGKDDNRGPKKASKWIKFVKKHILDIVLAIVFVVALVFCLRLLVFDNGPDIIIEAPRKPSIGQYDGKDFKIDIVDLTDTVLTVGKTYSLKLIGDSVNQENLNWTITGAIDNSLDNCVIRPNAKDGGIFSLANGNSGKTIEITCCDNDSNLISKRIISVR